MQELLAELIADFETRSLPKVTPRQTALPWFDGKVDTVIGMRRTGKTWFLFQVISELLEEGSSRESILYLNFEDERLAGLTASDLHWVTDVFYRRRPALRDQRCVLFFDEIHVVEGWERYVRRLLDTENVHLCLTGSSSKLMSREIATSLRGRSISTEIFPFSFEEFLRHGGMVPPIERWPSAAERSVLENRVEAYLLEGGFPETQGIEAQYRIRILQEYLDVVIFRDLIERHGVTNTTALRQLIRHLLSSPACLFSVNKFYGDLRSRGIRVSKDTLHQYLDHLGDAYLFFPIEIHSRSERARRVNPRKVYSIDTGLVRACSPRPQPNWGHLLENAVFIELRRRFSTIEYYRTASGREVDFLVTGHDGAQHLVQVCLDLSDPQTRQREVSALSEAMLEVTTESASVVTMTSAETLDVPGGSIEIVPAWRFLVVDPLE